MYTMQTASHIINVLALLVFWGVYVQGHVCEGMG